MDPAPLPSETTSIELLKRRIAALEGNAAQFGNAGDAGAAAVSLDTALDETLPWRGLPRGVLHEIAVGRGPGEPAAAVSFAAVLLARLANAGANAGARPGTILWVRPPQNQGAVSDTICGGRDAGLYGPGLAAFGLDPSRLIIANAGTPRDALWAIEEGLRAPGLAAVLGETDGIGLNASRRLQLAAEESGVTGLLLRGAGALDPAALPPSAAVTRWRVRPAPFFSGPSSSETTAGLSRWHLDLLRCRGGVPCTWTIDHDQETHRLALAAPVSGGPLDAAQPAFPSGLTFPEGVLPKHAAEDDAKERAALAG